MAPVVAAVVVEVSFEFRPRGNTEVEMLERSVKGRYRGDEGIGSGVQLTRSLLELFKLGSEVLG